MRQLEELGKRWQDSGRFRRLHAAMSLEKEGLVLGAKTVLAKRDHDGSLALDGEEARLLTLLSVAYGQTVAPSVLGKIRNASKHARAGDECMAAMHIALVGLPPLRDPSECARRLFIADGLMTEGMNPRDIWAALEFDFAPLDELEKRYNPYQPRVPAGNGRPSGQWTSGDGTSEAEAAADFVEHDATQEVVGGEISGAADTAASAAEEGLLDVGSRALLPLTLLQALLWSTPAGGERREGRVPGNPDLYWIEDEGLLTVARVSDGETILQATRSGDGKFRVLGPPALRRLLNEHALVDPETLPPEDPRSSQRRDEPQLCPEPPQLDKPQGTARSRAYVLYMKALVNQPPTPPGFGYTLYNPFQSGDAVTYDDCERDSGTLIEYKGPNYAKQLVDKCYGESFREDLAIAWLSQATRQIEASGGRPVRWYFAEQPALDFARNLFSKYPILKRIDLVYAPWLEYDR